MTKLLPVLVGAPVTVLVTRLLLPPREGTRVADVTLVVLLLRMVLVVAGTVIFSRGSVGGPGVWGTGSCLTLFRSARILAIMNWVDALRSGEAAWAAG